MEGKTAGLLILLALAFAGPSAALARDLPASGAGLGLSQEGGDWVYRTRKLTTVEADKVSLFLGILPANPDPLLERVARLSLAKASLKPEASPWFESDGQGGLRLSAAGRYAIVGIVLGGSAGEPEAKKTPAPPPDPKSKVDSAKVAAALGTAGLDPAPSFDGSSPRPLPSIYIGMSLPPTAEARSRNIQSIYHLYGYGTDRGLDAAFGKEDSAGKTAARVTKGFLLDIPIGLIGSFWQHELGHFEEDWRAGTSPYWSHSGATNVGGFLGETAVPDPQWNQMTPAQHMTSNAAGIFSTQSGAADARMAMLSGDKVPWSSLPPFAFWKMDSTIYGFITPKPGHTPSSESGFDTIQWRDTYAQRSGNSPQAVQRELLAGAIWNAADPMVFWSAATYFYNYLAKGKTEADNPMINLGAVQAMVGTSFWLSEVGAQYGASLLVREPKSRVLVQVTGTGEDSGQGAIEAKVANIPLTPWTWLRFSAALWAQRGHAEPGPNALGGSAGVGIDQKAAGPLWVSVDAAYKSLGALLGRDFAAGPYLGLGVKTDLPEPR